MARDKADGRRLMKRVHPMAGALALLTIATFWLSTAVSELFASEAVVAAVKTAIPWGFLLLIPALAAAGGSGFALAKGRRAGLIGAKFRRMPWIAANGILILIPAALVVDVAPVERALLVVSVLLVMIVELLNACVEAVVDRISLERHPLAKRAKDMGSAAVMLSLVVFAVVWGTVLWPLVARAA